MPKELEEFFKKPLKQRAIGEPIQIKEIGAPSVTSPNTLLQAIGSLVPQQPSTLTPRTQITSIKTESPRIETKPLTTPSAPITTSISPESLRQAGINTIIPYQKEQEFLQSEAQKIKTGQDRMKAIETGTIDIDEELKKHGLPSSKELEKRNINPEFVAKYPQIGKILTAIPSDKVKKFEEETLPGKVLSRIAETGAQAITGQQGEITSTGNTILDFVSSLAGIIGGYSVSGGIGGMARQLSVSATQMPIVENILSRVGKFEPIVRSVIRGGATGAIMGGTRETMAGAETEDILKTAATDAIYYAAADTIVSLLAPPIIRAVDNTIKKVKDPLINGVKLRYQAFKNRNVRDLVPIETTIVRGPTDFAKQGYKEIMPNSGIWIKYDTNGTEIERIYETVYHNGQIIPLYKLRLFRGQKPIGNIVKEVNEISKAMPKADKISPLTTTSTLTPTETTAPQTTPPEIIPQEIPPATVTPTETPPIPRITKPTEIIQGKTGKARTERGTTVGIQYAIVDLENLTASHDANLKVNPDYPQELQPRDRSRVASEIQVERMAKNLEPAFLGESPKASEGAPIVGDDLVVESGNARVIALNRAYNQGTADNYKQWLIDNAENFGLSKDEIASIEKPVLVRVRQSGVDRVKFAQEANEPSVATMSATEQAMTDAQKLDSGMLAQFYPTDDGNILNAQNRGFVGRFLDEVVGPAEKGNYITKDGSISQDGVRRIQNAIFAKAYGDTSSIEKLAESTDSNIKNITNAMLASAPRFIELKESIQQGNLFDLDITSDIAQAANKLSSLRESDMSVKLYRRQLTMLEDDISDLGKDLLDIFEKYKRSSKKMITILQSYADAVEALGHPSQLGLFGQPEVTKAEILEAALRRVEGEGEQTSIFQDEAGGSGVRATEAEGVRGPEEESPTGSIVQKDGTKYHISGEGKDIIPRPSAEKTEPEKSAEVAKEPWQMTKEEFTVNVPKGYKYIPDLGETIARHNPDGTITLTDAYFEHDEQTKKELLAHEKAHEIMKDVSNSKVFWDLVNSGLFGKYDSEAMRFKGIPYSFKNVEEVLTQLIADLQLDLVPKDFKDKYAVQYNIARQILDGKKINIEAAIKQAIEESKQKKVTDKTEDARLIQPTGAAGKRLEQPKTKSQDISYHAGDLATGAAKLPIKVSPDDIPIDIAESAYRNVSFDPKGRAHVDQRDYVNHMQSLYEELEPLAVTDEQKAILKDELERYKNKYIAMYTNVANARSRTASTMITGPAKFPHKKNQKALDALQKRLTEFTEWQKKAKESIKKKIDKATPQEALVDREYQRLRKELTETFATLKGIETGEIKGADPALFRSSLKGKLERSYKNGNHEAVRHALGEVRELQKQLKRPIFANNNSIWKLMDEVPEETKSRTGANTIAEYEGVTIQENFDEDRIQIIFDEKPAADVITALRKSGWRWAPSQGAWQRKLTSNANRSARNIISNFYQEKSQEVDHKPEKMQKGELTNIEKDKITFDEYYRAFDKDGYLIYEPSVMLRAKRKEAEGLEDFIEKYNYFKEGEIYILHDATPFTFKGVTRTGHWYFKNLVTGQDEYFKMHMTEGFKAIEETGKALEDFIEDKAKDREQFLEAPVKIRPKVKSEEAPPKTDKIVSQREIIDFLSEQLGVPIRTGKYRGPARGIFKRHPEVIRSRLANDLPVISHEIGHFLDKAWDLRSLKTDKNMLKEFEVLAQGVQGPRISEGIAQFVNFYITDPEYAKEVAPLFTEKFEEKLKENPDVRDVLLEARKQYGIWEKQSDLEKVKSMISFDREQKRPYTFERFYTQWVDELQPLKSVTDKMLKGSEIPVSRHPFYRAWLNRGWTGIAEAYLHNGQMDKNFNKIGPSLDEILKPIAKHESEDYIAYITAKRAIELHGRGINPGIPEEVAEGSIKELQGKYPIEKMRQFEQSFEELTEYQDNLLKVLVDSGVLSESSYNKMKALNRNYVPFYRLMEGFEKPRHIGGKRFADTSQPVKRIKGSGRQIINPLESVIKNTYTFINIAERNTVGRLLTELAESIEGSGQWVEKIDMPVKPTKIQLQEIERTLKNAGVDTKEVDLEQLAVIFRPYTYRSAKDNIVTIFKEGKPVMYQLDPELYIAVKSLDSQSAHWLTDILSVPAQWLRAGATLTPDFPAKNILRDQFTAYIYSKYGYLPVVDAIRGLSHVLKRDDLYWKWYASGGAHGALVSLDRDYMQKNFKKMLTERTKAQKAKGLLRSPIELLRDISEISEEATRIIEFKKGIEAEGVIVEKEIKSLNDKIDEIEKQLKRVKDNKERKELRKQLSIAYGNLKFLKENKEAEVYRRASLAARDMTLDFARGGYKARDLNRINAFFNAGIQGIDKLAREFRNNPSRTFFRIALLVTLPSLVCYMINRKNPYYEEVARHEKDTFWHIPIPGSKGQRFSRIPKPFEIGILFGTLPERFLEYVDKNDPKAFKEFENTLEEYVFQGLVPDKEFMFLPTGLIPTAFIPVIESFANKSIFTRTSIVPQSELSLAPSMQCGPGTSEVAKILGGILDVSPRKIDNTIRGYSGGLGRNVTDILDAVLVKTGLGESKIKPGSKDAIDVVSKIPAIGTYISKYPQAYQSPSINDFYDDYNKVEELYRTAKEKKEKEGRKLKITKKEAELIKLRPAMRKTANILSDIRKEQSKILYSNKLTGKEKAQKLHELNMLQLNLVRRIYGKEILK
jgi:hypothetical protein